MGDTSRIPVHEYGTSQMIINDNVMRVINSLHVPGLDSDLFSVTKHRHMDHGHLLSLKVEICTYCSRNFQSHNLFPKMMN